MRQEKNLWITLVNVLNRNNIFLEFYDDLNWRWIKIRHINRSCHRYLSIFPLFLTFWTGLIPFKWCVFSKWKWKLDYYLRINKHEATLFSLYAVLHSILIFIFICWMKISSRSILLKMYVVQRSMKPKILIT